VEVAVEEDPSAASLPLATLLATLLSTLMVILLATLSKLVANIAAVGG
jgi:hypothetical protein